MNITGLLLIAGSITFLLALMLSHLARKLGNIAIFRDYPDKVRKLHKRPVPSTGGLAIVAATMAGGLLLIPAMMEHMSTGMTGFTYYFAFAGALVAVSGIYDDVFGMSFKPKFFIQLFAAVIVLYGLETQFVAQHISYSETPLWGRLVVYAILGLWIVSGCNTINLVDGIDSLAGSIVLTVIFGILVISVSWGIVDVYPFIVPLAGAILGFLWFNRPPASLFMGDTGSMFSGFMIASSVIVLGVHATHWMHVLSLGLLLSIPISDTIFAIIRRIKFGQNPFESDNNHLHHMLQRYFHGPGVAVVILTASSVVMITIAVLLSNINSQSLFFFTFGILFGLFLLIAVTYSIKIQKRDSVLYSQLVGITTEEKEPEHLTQKNETPVQHDNADTNVRVSHLVGSHYRNGT